MVYYSKQAENDLEGILEGLLTSQKQTLTREFCLNNLFNMIGVCDSLDTKSLHSNTVYDAHKRYGKKVHKHLRRKNAVWYIIYDIDFQNNALYVNKIISSYVKLA